MFNHDYFDERMFCDAYFPPVEQQSEPVAGGRRVLDGERGARAAIQSKGMVRANVEAGGVARTSVRQGGMAKIRRG